MFLKFRQVISTVMLLLGVVNGNTSDELWFGEHVPKIQLEAIFPQDITGAESISGNLTCDGKVFPVRVQFKIEKLNPQGTMTQTNIVCKVLSKGGGEQSECEFELMYADRRGSRMLQYAGSMMAEQMNVVAPRINHAVLELNKRPQGVFIIKELVQMEKLDDRMGAREGVIFAVNEDGALKAKSSGQEIEGRFNKMKSWLAVDLLPPQAGLLEAKTIFNLDELTKVMVWECFVQSPENYFDNNSNICVFLNRKDGLFEVIPNRILEGFSVSTTALLTWRQGAVGKAIFSEAEGRRLWMKKLHELVDDQQKEETIVKKLSQRAEVIRANLRSSREAVRFEREWNLLKNSVTERYKQARKLLVELDGLSDSALVGVELIKINVHRLDVNQAWMAKPRRSNSWDDRFLEMVNMYSKGRSTFAHNLLNLSICSKPGELENLPTESTNWVRVTVTNEYTTITNAGLRLKGRITRENFNGKPSVTLKLNQTGKGQQILGMTKFHLNNAAMDPNCMNEFLAALLFARAQMPCPSAYHAQVRFNGIDYGIYSLVEGCSKPFLRRTFSREDGFLFEGVSTDINGPLDLDNGRPPKDYDGVMKLYQNATKALKSGQLTDLETTCDLERLARFVALEMFLGHVDGYTLSVNNYRLYQPAPGGQFILIPHGMDNLRLDSEAELFPDAKGVLAKVLFGTESGKGIYLRAFREILESSCIMDQITPVISKETVLVDGITGFRQEDVKRKAKLMNQLAIRRAAFEKKLAGVGYGLKSKAIKKP